MRRGKYPGVLHNVLFFILPYILSYRWKLSCKGRWVTENVCVGTAQAVPTSTIGFVKETQRFSDYLPDVCLMIEKDELAEAFIHAGIQRHQAHVLIKALKYENYNTQ